MAPPQWYSPAQREWLEAGMPDFVAVRTEHRLPQFWLAVQSAWIEDWGDFDAQLQEEAVRRKLWLEARLPKYLNAKTTGDQSDFFVALDEGWFKKWPEEAAKNLPAAESGVALTAEEQKTLSDALTARKKQIRSWFRNHTKTQRDSGAVPVKKNDTESMAAAIWKDKTRHRGPQLVELYQKLYRDRVRAALKAAGFYKKHRQDLEWVSEDGEQPDVAVRKTLNEQLSARMTIRRRVTMELLEGEEPEVLEALDQELARLKALSLTEASSELTPEIAQRSLDQLEGIVDNFHKILREKTGWVGFTMVGGPTPSAGGALSMQVFSSGHTPAGHTFKQAHPNWKTAVSSKFTEFLKLCFPRSARDAMALPDPLENIDDLIQMSDNDADEEAPSLLSKPLAPKKPKATKPKKPKPPVPTPITFPVTVKLAHNAAPTTPERTPTFTVPQPPSSPAPTPPAPASAVPPPTQAPPPFGSTLDDSSATMVDLDFGLTEDELCMLNDFIEENPSDLATPDDNFISGDTSGSGMDADAWATSTFNWGTRRTEAGVSLEQPGPSQGAPGGWQARQLGVDTQTSESGWRGLRTGSLDPPTNSDPGSFLFGLYPGTISAAGNLLSIGTIARGRKWGIGSNDVKCRINANDNANNSANDFRDEDARSAPRETEADNEYQTSKRYIDNEARSLDAASDLNSDSSRKQIQRDEPRVPSPASTNAEQLGDCHVHRRATSGNVISSAGGGQRRRRRGRDAPGSLC
ncbi:hypothetical protein C8F04DRAFT_1181455 [Mycena alexandri]|uniref:Uncharacterized protein n=1 Tax=Mycena alexandri TaxID=1745969 RepID=A0AAD6T341_9AGAR|nr:hypothetical protein C8F04DRAFT_1181455 [Mycena alexandri]